MTLAEIIHEGEMAKMKLEDEIIEDVWPGRVHSIGTDWYDNSLELYFYKNTPEDFSATKEEAEQILKHGFSILFLNFADGTEQYIHYDDGQVVVHDRYKVSVPRWRGEDE
jgi:hypothetical protein